MTVLYIFAKFALYCALCSALVRAFQVKVDSEWNFSIAWGAARFGVGLVFGIPIVFLLALLVDEGVPGPAAYLVAFGPLRLVEWAVLFALIARRHSLPWGPRAGAWIVAGSLASILVDGFAYVTRLHETKFVC